MWRITVLDEVESTNTFAREALSRGELSHGAVIQARHQQAGRGRFSSRKWQDAPDASLLMSIVLTAIAREQVSKVTFMLALAATSAIRDALGGSSHVMMKWPNDILIHRKKVSGILAEAVWSGAELLGVVAGIGVNVRQRSFDPELKDRATSLLREGSDITIDELRDSILERFATELTHASDERKLMDRVSSELAWLSEIPSLTIDLLDGASMQNARYLGVSSSGALMIHHDGVDHILHAASIRL